MVLTIEQLTRIFPASKVLSLYLGPLNDVINEHSLNTKNRLAMFLAQTGHESGGYASAKMVENLNYKTSALTAMFPNRITLSEATSYGRNDATGQKANQEAIANIIYGGAWGAKNLGNTNAGDGYKFRGRGAIQITGRSNYQKFAESIHKTIDEAIEYAETPKGAVEVACWFWNYRSLNALADAGDVAGCTRKINGGLLGLEERTAMYKKALTII